MPYSGTADTALPAGVKKLSRRQRTVWVRTYNEVRARGAGEGKAFAVAYTQAKRAGGTAAKGGEGSGNFGHLGRPGEVGGSQPRGGGAAAARDGAAPRLRSPLLGAALAKGAVALGGLAAMGALAFTARQLKPSSMPAAPAPKNPDDPKGFGYVGETRDGSPIFHVDARHKLPNYVDWSHKKAIFLADPATGEVWISYDEHIYLGGHDNVGYRSGINADRFSDLVRGTWNYDSSDMIYINPDTLIGARDVRDWSPVEKRAFMWDRRNATCRALVRAGFPANKHVWQDFELDRGPGKPALPRGSGRGRLTKLRGSIGTLKTVGKSAAEEAIEKGGEGSGNFGHLGRPGEVGGSQPGGGATQDGAASGGSAGLSARARRGLIAAGATAGGLALVAAGGVVLTRHVANSAASAPRPAGESRLPASGKRTYTHYQTTAQIPAGVKAEVKVLWEKGYRQELALGMLTGREKDSEHSFVVITEGKGGAKSGEVVGVAMLNKRPVENQGKRYLYVSALATKRYGYGMQAMMQIARYAESKGLGLTGVAMPKAAAFYKRIAGMSQGNMRFATDTWLATLATGTKRFYWDPPKRARAKEADEVDTVDTPEPEDGVFMDLEGMLKGLSDAERGAALARLGLVREAEKGGEGSGNFGHLGRPGLVGGSQPRGGSPVGLDTDSELIERLAERVGLREAKPIARSWGATTYHGADWQEASGTVRREDAPTHKDFPGADKAVRMTEGEDEARTYAQPRLVSREIETHIARGRFENAAVVRKQGDVAFFITTSSPNSVPMPAYTHAPSRDGVVTHNHPFQRAQDGSIFESTLSPSDLVFASFVNAKEIRAATPYSTFVARREPSSPDWSFSVNPALIQQEWVSNVLHIYRAGQRGKIDGWAGFSDAERSEYCFHHAWVEAADRWGFHYERIPHSDAYRQSLKRLNS